MSDVVSWAGSFFLGSAVVDGGRGSSGGVQVFRAPRICGRNQVDQNSVYGDSKRVLNSIGGTCTPPLDPLPPSTTAEPKKNNPAQETTSFIHRSHTIHGSYITC